MSILKNINAITQTLIPPAPVCKPLAATNNYITRNERRITIRENIQIPS